MKCSNSKCKKKLPYNKELFCDKKYITYFCTHKCFMVFSKMLFKS